MQVAGKITKGLFGAHCFTIPCARRFCSGCASASENRLGGSFLRDADREIAYIQRRDQFGSGPFSLTAIKCKVSLTLACFLSALPLVHIPALCCARRAVAYLTAVATVRAHRSIPNRFPACRFTCSSDSQGKPTCGTGKQKGMDEMGRHLTPPGDRNGTGALKRISSVEGRSRNKISIQCSTDGAHAVQQAFPWPNMVCK